MPDAMMYEEEMFVVLETDQPEQFLEPQALFEKLKTILEQRQDDLPSDFQRFKSIEDQTKWLMESSCELDLGPDHYLQWYVVRLEK